MWCPARYLSAIAVVCDEVLVLCTQCCGLFSKRHLLYVSRELEDLEGIFCHYILFRTNHWY